MILKILVSHHFFQPSYLSIPIYHDLIERSETQVQAWFTLSFLLYLQRADLAGDICMLWLFICSRGWFWCHPSCSDVCVHFCEDMTDSGSRQHRYTYTHTHTQRFKRFGKGEKKKHCASFASSSVSQYLLLLNMVSLVVALSFAFFCSLKKWMHSS